MASITLESLAHSYHPNPRVPEDYALKELSLQWEDGHAYALLGPSGCGKSTLLNIMSGLLEPTRGRILFGDKDVTHASTAERNIAQVFQFPVVYDTMTVGENLAFVEWCPSDQKVLGCGTPCAREPVGVGLKSP